MENNILIFGGSGFIGTHLIRYLANRSDINKIIIADELKPKIANKKIIFKKIDVSEPIPKDLFEGEINQIINLAAVHKTPGHKNDEYFDTNIKGAINISDFAKEKGVKKIIFTSSISVYGPSEIEKNETSIPKPQIPYGISKIIAEYIFKDWYSSHKEEKKLVIIRPAAVFGKGEKGNFTRISHALRNKIFIYPGRKDTIKSCCYVKDLCRFIIMQMKRENGFYLNNFCYTDKITIQDITTAFHNTLGYSKPFLIIPKFIVTLGANILKFISALIPFLKKFGFDPQRVEKLAKSTNISSKKLIKTHFKFKYPLEMAFKDWNRDCDSNKLF